MQSNVAATAQNQAFSGTAIVRSPESQVRVAAHPGSTKPSTGSVCGSEFTPEPQPWPPSSDSVAVNSANHHNLSSITRNQERDDEKTCRRSI
jgi:hypothetical protein